MSTFRSIEELVKSLEREKELLKEMFCQTEPIPENLFHSSLIVCTLFYTFPFPSQ